MNVILMKYNRLRIIINFLLLKLIRIKWFIKKKIVCYVDSENGNDNNLGFIEKKPLKTLKVTFDRLPKVIKYPIYINLSGYFNERETSLDNIMILKDNLYIYNKNCINVNKIKDCLKN